MSLSVAIRRCARGSAVCLALGLISIQAFAEDEVRITGAEDRATWVFVAASLVATDRISESVPVEEAVVMDHSDIARELQLRSDHRLTVHEISEAELTGILFSDEFLRIYNSAHRGPNAPGEIVPQISYPEAFLNRVLRALRSFDPKERVISITALARKAKLGAPLVEAILWSKDFQLEKTWAIQEGRPLPMVFPVTGRDLHSAIRRVAKSLGLNVKDVRALNVNDIAREAERAASGEKLVSRRERRTAKEVIESRYREFARRPRVNRSAK
jgi:hypothetical protein